MSFLVLCLINENEYDSRIRVSTMKMTVILKLKLFDFYNAEEELSIQLKKSLQEIEEISKEKKENIIPMLHRIALIGTGSFLGGLGLMLTGLVVSPLIIPAALGIIGLSSLAGSTIVLFGGPFVIAGLFGLSGSGLVGYMVSKRTAGLNQFQFYKIPIYKNDFNVQEEEEEIIEEEKEKELKGIKKNFLLNIDEINVEIDKNLLLETESNDFLIHEDDLILTEKDEKEYKKIYPSNKIEEEEEKEIKVEMNEKKKKIFFVKEENEKLIINEIKEEEEEEKIKILKI